MSMMTVKKKFHCEFAQRRNYIGLSLKSVWTHEQKPLWLGLGDMNTLHCLIEINRDSQLLFTAKFFRNHSKLDGEFLSTFPLGSCF